MTVAFPSLCAHCEASERPDSSTAPLQMSFWCFRITPDAASTRSMSQPTVASASSLGRSNACFAFPCLTSTRVRPDIARAASDAR